MTSVYLIFNFILVLIFIRNYHGIKRKVTARLTIIFFIIAFILSVLFPNLVTQVASFFGFGRGADFIFYNFVIFSLGVFGLLYKKIFLLERRLVHLNRQASIFQSSTKADGE